METIKYESLVLLRRIVVHRGCRLAIKYAPRIYDISTRTNQIIAYKPGGFLNPGTAWLDLPINGGSSFTIAGQGHLVGLLIRAEGLGDAQYCSAGIRVDGSPSQYWDWPSGGMSPYWLNFVLGPGKSLGSNFPFQLLKFDTANNRYVVWADFPYPGWPFQSSLRLGARLQSGGSSGTLLVSVTAFLGSATPLQVTP
jgi:hypothetical protein